MAALFVSTLASAQGQPSLMLHIDQVPAKNVCSSFVPSTDCADVVVKSPAGDGLLYNVYLLTATGGDMLSYAGCEFSIFFTEDPAALGMFAWTNCADLQFRSDDWGDVPVSGSGNLLTFDSINNCQDSDSIVVNGFFYVGAYGDSQMGLGPRGSSGVMKVADCSSAEFVLDHNKRSGSIGFGNSGGCNSCLADCVVPVEETTWGGVKTLFKGE